MNSLIQRMTLVGASTLAAALLLVAGSPLVASQPALSLAVPHFVTGGWGRQKRRTSGR